jgi:hypothetical protein
MPQLKPTRGIRLNKSHPLARGLVGCWLFNEGSGNKVSDLSGNGNTGTITGAIWTPWKYGPALKFNGNSDLISFAVDKPSIAGLSNVSFFTWLEFDVVNVNHWIASESQFNGGYLLDWHLILLDSSDKIRLRIDTSGGADTVDTTTVFVAGQPYHVGFTYDGTTMKLYVNGRLENSTVHSSGGTINDSNYPLNLGSGDNRSISLIDGYLDIPMIYNRTFIASEIALLYREPFCMFERAWIPKLIGGQIVELAGSSVALSSLSATAKAMRKVGGNVVSTTDVTAILNLIRSLLYIESNWKREALFNGMTANAFKLGTTLSLGWFWVRVTGCSVLYRGSSIGEIDFVNILAVSEQDAREISPPSYISHNSGSTYFYVVRRFNNCGYQECTLAASVKVSIEPNGELAQPQPNKVFDSEAELVDGNKIQLVWYYCPLEQKSQPTCFNVYYDGRTGQIDYENPLAIIGYKGRKFYSYQCGALEAGRYLFAIRTEDVSGIENSSLARLRIQFDPTNPEAIDILSAEGV